jgi:hypothetical protein
MAIKGSKEMEIKILIAKLLAKKGFPRSIKKDGRKKGG